MQALKSTAHFTSVVVLLAVLNPVTVSIATSISIGAFPFGWDTIGAAIVGSDKDQPKIIPGSAR